ncbi:MAG: hypothetical protein JRF61_16410 [Deltaproteobacteria bacterium]|jgi:hypothetical protein|nr:hypothetical protein [Deltaproteobacteria bacterium]
MKVYRPVPLESDSEPTAPSALRHAIEMVGIVDDKLDPHLIEGVVAGLADLLPEASIRVWSKPIGTSPAPDALIEEVTRESQVTLAGVGM